ncbi:MAG TPA: aminoglycoside 6'-N-acetyltransferase [Pirellulales bacterium]|jgi:aminoglycoside 6'-N-acetyltransferase I|nr:aminoglycoside 6'-N-acetyltransferase [Pirellulales bacterium]
MFVRPAKPHDHAAWIEMRQALWPECPHAEQLVEAERTLASEIQAVFVAESPTGELCGFIEMALREFASGCATTPVGYIEGWYVKPQFHRQGIGRALVAAGERWAVERGCVEMASDALLANAVSQQAHRALGYEESERLVCFRKGLPARNEDSSSR